MSCTKEHHWPSCFFMFAAPPFFMASLSDGSCATDSPQSQRTAILYASPTRNLSNHETATKGPAASPSGQRVKDVDYMAGVSFLQRDRTRSSASFGKPVFTHMHPQRTAQLNRIHSVAHSDGMQAKQNKLCSVQCRLPASSNSLHGIKYLSRCNQTLA